MRIGPATDQRQVGPYSTPSIRAHPVQLSGASPVVLRDVSDEVAPPRGCSVEEKLGFSAPPPPQPEPPGERALASSQRGESDRVETRCVIAAVMTDAEIAACRKVRQQ